jgi:hypothetical protein
MGLAHGLKAERRRSRTYPPVGYTGWPILKVARKMPICRACLLGAPVDAPVSSYPRLAILSRILVAKPQPSDYETRGLPERTILERKIMEFGSLTSRRMRGATAGVRAPTGGYERPHDSSGSRQVR